MTWGKLTPKHQGKIMITNWRDWIQMILSRTFNNRWNLNHPFQRGIQSRFATLMRTIIQDIQSRMPCSSSDPQSIKSNMKPFESLRGWSGTLVSMPCKNNAINLLPWKIGPWVLWERVSVRPSTIRELTRSRTSWSMRPTGEEPFISFSLASSGWMRMLRSTISQCKDPSRSLWSLITLSRTISLTRNFSVMWTNVLSQARKTSSMFCRT